MRHVALSTPHHAGIGPDFAPDPFACVAGEDGRTKIRTSDLTLIRGAL
jgi:hypothetical protein